MELAFAFLMFACHRESLSPEQLERAKTLALKLGDPLLAARTSLAIALFTFRIDFSNARQRANEALELAELSEDAYLIARAHKVVGNVADFHTEPKPAIEHISKSYQGLLLCQSATEAAVTGVYLAVHLWHSGRVEEADAIVERSRPTIESSRDPGALAYLNEIEGRMSLDRGNPVDAEGFFRESLRIWQAIGSVFQEADQNHSLTHALIGQGKWSEARQHLIAAGELWFKDENKGGLCCSNTLVSAILRSQGEVEAARNVLAFAFDFEKEHSLVLVENELDFRAKLREQLGGVGSHKLPLTLESGLSLFDQIR